MDIEEEAAACISRTSREAAPGGVEAVRAGAGVAAWRRRRGCRKDSSRRMDTGNRGPLRDWTADSGLGTPRSAP